MTPAAPFAYASRKVQVLALHLCAREAAAEAACTRALAHRPDDAWALATRSHLRAGRGDRSGAIADARRLVATHPRPAAAAWFNLGFLLEAEGRLAEAEDALRAALALDARLDRAWYGLGLVLIGLGRADEAVAALEQNTRLQPLSPYGWYQLAKLHARRQAPLQAIEIIRRLKGFEPRVAAQLERETGLMS
ncbi:MAG: tetratricopeptide repeat protein [Burkholderiales bacterium]|nr:tetratricopeptide repeat protein [Burkholderiales bacterium]MDE1926650.1 tetratricopeptide repeat protein [Burkholderiales bacterium]MDE2159545.1 tetratricopeptide repeat protein [Burkholderiales bacterium]MDE2502871.1 tetratricopeptide repeat protein [Burkholderiales bacterium]